MFSSQPRCHYRRAQVAEVICQLRFPEILSISAKAHADGKGRRCCGMLDFCKFPGKIPLFTVCSSLKKGSLVY